MKHKLLFFMAFFLPCLVFAQGNVSVKGSVIGAVSNDPIPGVIVTVTELNRQVTTDADGIFTIRNIQPGTYVIQLNSVMITPKSVSIEVENLGVTELKPIRVTELNANEDVSMIGIIDAGMVDDDVETSGQDVSSTVILSNDIFLNKAAYQLSPARFSPRGYNSTQEVKYINGVEFNDQNRGVFNYAAVGALNDMTRNGDVTNFTAPSSFTFGELGGTENINMRASSYTPGGKLTLSYTNRNYYLRGMPNDRDGCLQDSHWSSGAFGYFPSYALGNAYGAQMLHNMEQDVDVEDSIAKGELAPITAWLHEKVHQYGGLYVPADVVKNACGTFDPHYYTDYLTRKFSELYGL